MCRFHGQKSPPKLHDTIVVHSQRGPLLSCAHIGATVVGTLGLLSSRSRKAKKA